MDGKKGQKERENPLCFLKEEPQRISELHEVNSEELENSQVSRKKKANLLLGFRENAAINKYAKPL